MTQPQPTAGRADGRKDRIIPRHRPAPYARKVFVVWSLLGNTM